MNKWKYYIKAGLMAFVLSPLICTLGSFSLYGSIILFHELMSWEGGWHTALPGFIPPVLLLVFLWNLFCKKTKMPESWGQRIAPVMAAFIYYIGAWTVIFAIYQFTHKPRVWDLQFWLMPPYLVVHFIALLSANFTFFPVMQLASTLISLATLVFTCRKKQPPAAIDRSVPWYGAVIIGVVAIMGIFAIYRCVDNKVAVIYDGIDLSPYQPFSPKIPQLPVESSLTLTGDLPVLDGALALYPVYSAFATAVYPKAAYPLHMRPGRDGLRAWYDGDAFRADDKPHPVHFTNTVTGFRGLLDGRVDIYFMAEISNDQKQMAEEKNIDLVFTPIGKEAFVFFVNAKNPVNSLSVQDIRDIYAGRITQWEKLGGKGSIKAFQRHKNSGSQSALEHFMIGDRLMAPPTNEEPGDMGGIVRSVADYKNYEGAIGFSFRFFATGMITPQQIKLLEINGVAPTEENIRNGSYPLITDFYAITRRDNPNPNTWHMVAWMKSDQGQYLIREVGYTPIRTVAFPQHSPFPGSDSAEQ